MLLWSNGAPFLIQVISDGGILVAEQVKVTGSSSFTVHVCETVHREGDIGYDWRRQKQSLITVECKTHTQKKTDLEMVTHHVATVSSVAAVSCPTTLVALQENHLEASQSSQLSISLISATLPRIKTGLTVYINFNMSPMYYTMEGVYSLTVPYPSTWP